MTTPTPVSGKVTWFEVASRDVPRAAAFYSGLFGWQPQGDEPYALFGVEVADVDQAYAAAVGLGATSVIEPTDNPGGVRSAYLRDPDGSLFAVYRFGPRTT